MLFSHCEEERRGNLPNNIKIKLRIHKDDYFEKVTTMLSHIHRGDIYEANFCQEFYAEETVINPLETYFKLNQISKPPFATFLKCIGFVFNVVVSRALFNETRTHYYFPTHQRNSKTINNSS